MSNVTGQTNYYQNCFLFGTCTPSTGKTIFNETYMTTCCSTDNCNFVTLPPKVSSCFVGENTVFNLNNQTILKYSVTKTNCQTPKNQMCMTYLTTFNDSKINMTSISYLCADSCIPGIDSSGSVTKCCYNDNCNCPSDNLCSNAVPVSIMSTNFVLILSFLMGLHLNF